MELKTRNELPKYFKESGFSVGAEIGVYKGAFSEMLCSAGLKVYAIDPWHSYDSGGRITKDNKRNQYLYNRAYNTLKKYPDCTIIRKTSMDAVPWFKDESLDFVYIDGDHNFKHIAQDIYEWTYKVRKGGIVAGHDYKANVGGIEKNINHVGPVVDAYVKAFGIKKLYIIGRKDHASSWFFIR